MAKRAINGGVEVDMDSALELEEYCYEQLLHTKDRLEGLAAFAERRKPEYTGEWRAKVFRWVDQFWKYLAQWITNSRLTCIELILSFFFFFK